MHTCRLKAAFHTRFVNFNVCKDCNILSNNFHCRLYIHLMHKFRLKAGFPTIFEIMSAKSEGGVKYMCLKTQICYPSKKPIGIYMSTKAAFHTRFVNF